MRQPSNKSMLELIEGSACLQSKLIESCLHQQRTADYVSQAQTIAKERHLEPISTVQLEYSLVERNIEFEYVPMAKTRGCGVMVWSPLASGLLSGKYKPSESGGEGSGRLATLVGGDNPAFNKFTERNWAIVSELEKVAKEVGRSMAQVAVNWVVNHPGVASVLIGAPKLYQLAQASHKALMQQ